MFLFPRPSRFDTAAVKVLSDAEIKTSDADDKLASVHQTSYLCRILPKEVCSLADIHGPLFFLAGPLSGGEDWQSRMCEALLHIIPTGFTVAIPYGMDDMPRSVQPPFSTYTVLKPVTRTERQLAWERHYLDLAAGASQARVSVPPRGCIVPAESAMFPKPTWHGPYAQDTRGELGEWRGRLMHVVGDRHFPGFSKLERNFKHALGDDFKVHRTMEETAAAASAFGDKP